MGHWLLIFDNAQVPVDVAGWLPGNGHTLITSRERGWDELAASVEVGVLAREESTMLFRIRAAELSEADADRLAIELGDLPLAISQAAGFMAETGMAGTQYLNVLQTRTAELLDRGIPESYPQSLVAITHLIVDRLGDEDPAAAELATLCAFLAPEPIPLGLFAVAFSLLPAELACLKDDVLAWRVTLGHLARQSLARVDHRGLQMHRLTQAILRDRLSPVKATTARKITEALLVFSNPRSPADPATWARWASLMPHLLAADLAATDNVQLRWMACNAIWYLLARGDTGAAKDLAHKLRDQWRNRLGGDDVTTLEAAHMLGWARRRMGDRTEALNLHRDTLDRARHALGKDHPHTLTYANEVAIDLHDTGNLLEARDLSQDTLDRRRRVLGEDHENTLRSAGNLARDLFALGETQAARDLSEDTLDRMHRVFGQDHPDSLSCAENLAAYIRELGDVQAAYDLDQDTLARSRRVLGEDHPSTIGCALNLATDLHMLGQVQAARDLNQDLLDRARRVLGEDDPLTSQAAQNLAANLSLLSADPSAAG
jgi:hypothetical protein